MVTKKYIISLLIMSFLLPFSVSARTFNPSYIISDEEILDPYSMTLEEIKQFLDRKGGYLATYQCANPEGKMMSTAEVIHDRAVTNKVNPKFIIVLLQKEQSLIESKNPKQSQLDWATGYGCPDSAACNTRWKGLWKQINSASLQFRDYMDNPHLYTYKAGQTYTFTNPYGTIKNEPMTVTPVNQATAALYNYTPHVYNGDYNFFNIWQRYFAKSYPDGSLLQAKGEPGIWLIKNGVKRAFHSKGALTSRYDMNKVITVNKSDLDKYDTGKPIKYAQYSVVRSPKGTIYLLIDDTKRGFASGEAFKKIGINPEELIDVSWDDLDNYLEGAPITATSTYPTGALLQDNKTGGVFWVIDGTKSPVWDAVFLKTKFKSKKIISVAGAELAKMSTVVPVRFDDGELLKTPSSAGVYVISENKKRLIGSGEIFLGLGYKWNNILTVSDKVLNLYEEGDPIIDLLGNTPDNASDAEANVSTSL